MTSSTTAMLVMGDALAMAILQARGFKQEDFAKYHPNGAIGRAMEWSVEWKVRLPAPLRSLARPHHPGAGG